MKRIAVQLLVFVTAFAAGLSGSAAGGGNAAVLKKAERNVQAAERSSVWLEEKTGIQTEEEGAAWPDGNRDARPEEEAGIQPEEEREIQSEQERFIKSDEERGMREAEERFIQSKEERNIQSEEERGIQSEEEWFSQSGGEGDRLPAGEDTDIHAQTDELLADLGLSEIDAYMNREETGNFTFTSLVKELIKGGVSLDFASVGEKLKQAVIKDYAQNRTVLIQVLILSIAFSVLIQMTSALSKSYIPDLGFLGIYLIVMMLLLRLFLITAGTAESYLAKLTEFMQLLQPAFCMSVVFSNGSISAGAFYQLLLLMIYLADVVFGKILLPAVHIYMVLQLVNHLTEERFSRIAGLLSDSIHWCVKILMTALAGLNIVQGLLAPGIDGLKRSTIAGAVQAVPGAGQIMNSMTQMLAGSAMLVKNSVGVAALVALAAVSFFPLVKVSVFMLLYRGLAALMEPVSDKRFCAAVAALGQSAALCLKIMFYAAMMFFLTTAVICASTTLAG